MSCTRSELEGNNDQKEQDFSWNTSSYIKDYIQKILHLGSPKDKKETIAQEKR